MKPVRMVVAALGLAFVTSPWVVGDEPAKVKDPAPRMRGQLPQNWGKLGLSDEQKQKVYEVQTRLRAKIDALEKQMAELKDQQKKEMEGILTTAQKARLREIIAGKVPADGATDTKKDKP
jgi:hypothetical protein